MTAAVQLALPRTVVVEARVFGYFLGRTHLWIYNQQHHVWGAACDTRLWTDRIDGETMDRPDRLCEACEKQLEAKG